MKDWIRKGTEELRVRQHGETVVLSWKALEKIPFVRQCFSTRQGGVSEGFLSSMNFSFDRGDDPDHVRENYRRIAETIGVPADSFVVAHQTHTTNILVVDNSKFDQTAFMVSGDLRNVDIVVTDVRPSDSWIKLFKETETVLLYPGLEVPEEGE